MAITRQSLHTRTCQSHVNHSTLAPVNRTSITTLARVNHTSITPHSHLSITRQSLHTHTCQSQHSHLSITCQSLYTRTCQSRLNHSTLAPVNHMSINLQTCAHYRVSVTADWCSRPDVRPHSAPCSCHVVGHVVGGLTGLRSISAQRSSSREKDIVSHVTWLQEWRHAVYRPGTYAHTRAVAMTTGRHRGGQSGRVQLASD